MEDKQYPPFCIEITERESKHVYYVAAKSEQDRQEWLEALRVCLLLKRILPFFVKFFLQFEQKGSTDYSEPTFVKHNLHVEYDPVTGEFNVTIKFILFFLKNYPKGLPPEWKKIFNESGITREEIISSPGLVLKAVSFANNWINANPIIYESYPVRPIPMPKTVMPSDLETLGKKETFEDKLMIFFFLVYLTSREDPLTIFTDLQRIGKGYNSSVLLSFDSLV